MRIDAEGLRHRSLNEQIHAAVDQGTANITVDNLRGQRYLGAGLNAPTRLTLNGVPGNDLGVFMNGAELIVNGNVQDGVGNTMNAGKITVHGRAGDVLAHSMRGGKVFVRGDVGYRAGIHMKAYHERFPVVIIGGTAGDYLGEYMAGGLLVVLDLADSKQTPLGACVGTGMHGGTIFLQGRVEAHQLGREVGLDTPGAEDWTVLKPLLTEFCADFSLDPAQLRPDDFVRLSPKSRRPYGNLYAY